jgi:class 3 adenylate cyclase
MVDTPLAEHVRTLGLPAEEALRWAEAAGRVPFLRAQRGPVAPWLRLGIVAAGSPALLRATWPALVARLDAHQEDRSFVEAGIEAHLRALAAWRLDDDLPEALACLEEGRTALDEAGDEGAAYVGRVGDTLGQVLLHQGRLGAAREVFAEALACKQRAGDAAGVALTQGNLARLLAALGEFQAAAQHFAADLAWVEAQPSMAPSVVHQLATELGVCRMETGELDEAGRLLARALEGASQHGDPVGTAFARVHLGRLALRRGDPAAAREAARLVRAGLHPLPADALPELRGLAEQLEGRALAARDDAAGARQRFAAARAWFDAAPRVSALERAELLEAEAAAAETEGDTREAAEALRNALAALDATSADALRTRLEEHLRRLDPAVWMLHASGRFVGHREIEFLLDEAGRGGFRGHEVEVAVLFSDLRGFTRFAETLEPATLVDILNTYFGDMTRCIEHFGGRVDKFIGDAVMAVFPAGCHARGPGHAAARAALAMQVELARLNRFLPKGTPPLAAGIGVHIGPVIAGLIGSPRKRSFTIMGDTVNTASRIEGMTKLLDAPVLLSDAVLAALPADDPLLTVPLGRFRPKGRAAAVGVHHVVGRGRAGPRTRRGRLHAQAAAAAHALRQEGRSEAAREAFRALAEALGPGEGRGAFVRWAAAPALPSSLPASSPLATEDAVVLEEK